MSKIFIKFNNIFIILITMLSIGLSVFIIFLLDGISISSLTFSNITAKNIFIKLDNKLILKVEHIKVKIEDSK
jgi:hypothetical protein